MARPTRQNWTDELARVYVVLTVLPTIVIRLVDDRSPMAILPASPSSLVAIAIAACVLLLVWLSLTKERKHWRKGGSNFVKKVARHHRFRTLTSLWVALGLQANTIGSLMTNFEHHHAALGADLIEVALLGPLAIIAILWHASSVNLSGPLFVVLYFGWMVGVVALAVRNKDVLHSHAWLDGMKTTLDPRKKSERAPEHAPKTAHFAQVIEEIEDVHLSDPSNRIPIGYAELAPGWGAKKNKELLGLPEEGSALVLGSPGSCKSLILQTVLLSQRAPTSGEDLLPTKIVVLSTKTDLAAATVSWIRSRGGAVGHWDLSGKVDDDRYGELVRWSSLVSVKDWDSAKKMAKRLVAAGRESGGGDRVNEFFLQAAQSVLGPSLLAAKLAGRNYQTSLWWSSHWNDPDLMEVDNILAARGEIEALDSWQHIKRMLLEKHVDAATGQVTWSEPRGGVGAGEATGMSIDQTLQGLLLDVNTKAAHKATDDPNLDPREWVRANTTTPTVLYLTGNEFEEGMTRSVLTPFLYNLLVEAYELASEQPGGVLPYRLIILADELAQLAPIEGLERFFAGARSRGIQFVVCFQSAAQVEETYGRPAMRTLFDSAAVFVVLSGLRDRDLYATLSEIAGHEEVTTTSEHEAKNTTSTTTGTQMRSLIDGHVLRSLARPKPARRKGGEGLFLAGENVVRITVPIWTCDERWSERGTPPPKFQKLHAEFRDEQRRRQTLPHRRMVAWIRRATSTVWSSQDDAADPCRIQRRASASVDPGTGRTILCRFGAIGLPRTRPAPPTCRELQLQRTENGWCHRLEPGQEGWDHGHAQRRLAP